MRARRALPVLLVLALAVAASVASESSVTASESASAESSAGPGSPFGELLPEPYRSYLSLDLNEASTALGRMGVPAELSESAEKEIHGSIARSQRGAHPDDIDEDGLPKPAAIVYSAALGAAAHLSKKAVESSQPVPQELHADSRYHFGKEPYVVLSLPPNLKVMHAAMKQAARDEAGISNHYAYRTHQQDGAHPLAHVPVVPEDYQSEPAQLPADPLDPRAMDAVIHQAFADAERQLPPAFDTRLLQPQAKPRAKAPAAKPAKPFRIAFPPLPAFAAHPSAGHAHSEPDDHPLGALLTDPDIDIPFIMLEEGPAPQAAESLSSAIDAERESLPSQGIFEYMAHAAWDGLKRLGSSIASAAASAASSLKGMVSHIEQKALPEASPLPSPTGTRAAIGTVDGHEVFQSVRDIYSEPPSPIADDRPSPLSVLDRMSRHGRARKAPPAPRPSESLLPVVGQFKAASGPSASASAPSQSSAHATSSAVSASPSPSPSATSPGPGTPAASPVPDTPKAAKAPESPKAALSDPLPPLGVSPAPSAAAPPAAPVPQVSIVKPTVASTPDFVVSSNAAAAAGPARSNAAIDAINREAAKQRPSVPAVGKQQTDPALSLPIRQIIDRMPARVTPTDSALASADLKVVAKASSPPAAAPPPGPGPLKRKSQESSQAPARAAELEESAEESAEESGAPPPAPVKLASALTKAASTASKAPAPVSKEPSPASKAPAPASKEPSSASKAPSPASKEPSSPPPARAPSARPGAPSESAESRDAEDADEESAESAEPLNKAPRSDESTAWKHELMGLGLFTQDQMRSRAAAKQIRATLLRAQTKAPAAPAQSPKAPAAEEAEPEPLPAADAALLKRLQSNYNFDRPAPTHGPAYASQAPKAPRRSPDRDTPKAPKAPRAPDSERDLPSKARLAAASVSAASELVSAADELLVRFAAGHAEDGDSEEDSDGDSEAAEDSEDSEGAEGAEDDESATPLAPNAHAPGPAPAAHGPAAPGPGLGLELPPGIAAEDGAADGPFPFDVVPRLADDAEFNMEALALPTARPQTQTQTPSESAGAMLIPDPFMGFSALARPSPSPGPAEEAAAEGSSILEVAANSRARALGDLTLEEIMGPRIVM